jgi:hypothetical protein
MMNLSSLQSGLTLLCLNVPNPGEQEWPNEGETTMTYQDTNLSKVENVGPLDRVNRMIVAMSAIAVAVTFTAIPPAALFGIVAVSLYAGLSAATGWDPLFVVVKALSQRAPGQIPATVTTLHRQEEQPADGDHKKAA